MHRSSRFFMLVGALCCAMLFGCGDNEPEQRKAFLSVLEEKVFTQKEIQLAPLKEEEKKLVGSYAAHYDILLRAVEFVKETTRKDMSYITGLLAQVAGISDATKRKELLGEASAALAAMEGDMRKQFDALTAAKAALQQPEDLKLLFDKAYTQLAATPLQGVLGSLEASKALMAKVQELNDLVLENPDKLEYSGSTILVKDNSIVPLVDANIKEQEALEKKLREKEKVLRDATTGEGSAEPKI